MISPDAADYKFRLRLQPRSKRESYGEKLQGPTRPAESQKEDCEEKKRSLDCKVKQYHCCCCCCGVCNHVTTDVTSACVDVTTTGVVIKCHKPGTRSIVQRAVRQVQQHTRHTIYLT